MQERIAAAAQDQALQKLTAKTMEGYATRLIPLFDYFKDEDDPTWFNPAADFGKFEELGEASRVRKMWDGEPLKALFSSPVWTGCSSERFPRKAGPCIFANERYWLPILALFHGARLEELARLVGSEVREEGGIHYLAITDHEPTGMNRPGFEGGSKP